MFSASNINEVANSIRRRGFAWIEPTQSWQCQDSAQEINEFFSQPLSEKLKYQCFVDGSRSLCGFTPFGQEHPDAPLTPDMNESLVIGPHWLDSPAWNFPRTANWLANFSRSFKDCSGELLSGLGLDTRSALWLFAQFNSFPPVCDLPLFGKDKTRVGAHVDPGLLTLFPWGVSDGLQIKNPNGVWQAIPQPRSKNAILILPGELMELVSHGQVRAMAHRVRLPEQGDQPRFSMNVELMLPVDAELPPQNSGCQRKVSHFLHDYLASEANSAEDVVDSDCVKYERTDGHKTLLTRDSRHWLDAVTEAHLGRDKIWVAGEAATTYQGAVRRIERAIAEQDDTLVVKVPTRDVWRQACKELGLYRMPSTMVYWTMIDKDLSDERAEDVYIKYLARFANIDAERICSGDRSLRAELHGLRAIAMDLIDKIGIRDSSHLLGYWGAFRPILPSAQQRESLKNVIQSRGLRIDVIDVCEESECWNAFKS